MNAQESPYQQHLREMTEGAERLRAGRSPEQVKVDAALALTDKERDALTAADATVEQAEARVNAAGMHVAELETRARSETVFVRGDRGKSMRSETRYPEGYAEAREDLPDARRKLDAARSDLQRVIRDRNHVARRIEVARFARRRQAKAEMAPPRVRPQSRADLWSSESASRTFGAAGRKGAA